MTSYTSSDSDDDILALYLLLKRRKRRRHRRLSVHEIFQSRSMYGEYHHLVQELYFHPEKFAQYFRMTERQFDYVLGLIEDDIRKEDTNLRKAITPRERLAVCLRFLSTGDSYKTISFSYRIGITTVSQIIREVCDAIWTRLQPYHLPAPSKAQWHETSQGYVIRWNFPNCLGALDGKHVLIQAPPNSGSKFFNYKKTFSMVLLGLVDYKYCFTLVDIGSYGSNNDAGIFRRSALNRKLENGTLQIPDDKPLPNAQDRGHFPHIIVGDEAFPLLRNLMRPYPGIGIDDAKCVFNYRLSRARRISENAFGILANRWRLYHRKIPLSPENVESVVKATIVLHNMLQSESATDNHYPNVLDDDLKLPDENIHDGILRPLPRQGHRPRNEAKGIRDSLKDYFVSPQGAVTWQNSACFGTAI